MLLESRNIARELCPNDVTNRESKTELHTTDKTPKQPTYKNADMENMKQGNAAMTPK